MIMRLVRCDVVSETMNIRCIDFLQTSEIFVCFVISVTSFNQLKAIVTIEHLNENIGIDCLAELK